jgi:hypothetical protein
MKDDVNVVAGNGAVVLKNEDVTGIIAEIPPGHRHLRTTILLADGSSLTLQEATVAALVRAYVIVKTHPIKTRVVMSGARESRRKCGYAEWQLHEES